MQRDGTRRKRALRSIALIDRPLPVHEATVLNPALPTSETQLFVVHVWRQRTRFRASVRRVDDEQTQLFTNATQLARYFAAVTASTSNRADPQPLSRRT